MSIALYFLKVVARVEFMTLFGEHACVVLVDLAKFHEYDKRRDAHDRERHQTVNGQVNPEPVLFQEILVQRAGLGKTLF